MNRKLKLRMVVLIIVMLALIGSPALTLANDKLDERPPAPTVGFPAGTSAPGGDPGFGIMSQELLKIWNAAIMVNSSNSVEIRGFTDTLGAVEKVAIRLTLQYWDQTNLEWVDVAYAGEWFNLNSSTVTASTSYYVTTGQYYQTKAYHYAIDGSIIESKTSYSGYVYVP